MLTPSWCLYLTRGKYTTDSLGLSIGEGICPLPTFTALLLIAPVGTVQMLIADPAEVDASAIFTALELCRAHCKGREGSTRELAMQDKTSCVRSGSYIHQ